LLDEVSASSLVTKVRAHRRASQFLDKDTYNTIEDAWRLKEVLHL
jgi:hypothetical protein